MDIDSKSEKRLFARIGLDFMAVISIGNKQKTAYKDKVRLVDISGSGVKFTSSCPSIYNIGQIVSIAIDLPATSEVKALMNGVGRVVRIQPEVGNEISDQKTAISICLDTPLRLVRNA